MRSIGAQIVAAFEPKVALSNGEMIDFEALGTLAASATRYCPPGCFVSLGERAADGH